MFKMMNPLGSSPIPSFNKSEGEEGDMTREERIEQEKQKKADMARAEKERKARYLKEREGRDNERNQMRDKYNIKKPVRTEEEEESSDEEGDNFGPKKPIEEKDAMEKAKTVAVDKLQDATNMVSSFLNFRR